MRIIPPAAQDAGDSFQEVALGIKALCAAAAVVAGMGSAADAATVDRVKITLNAEYICENGPCDDPAPDASTFYGIPTGRAVLGDLYIGDRDVEWRQLILFISKGNVHNFGSFIDPGGNGHYDDDDLDYTSFSISWDGSKGSVYFRDDPEYWSLQVLGTIELAPVPLPASAALLPMGLGALAMMRRRRRS